ncbi:hypothetical protein Tco_0398192 [Tanacetum coccineum]
MFSSLVSRKEKLKKTGYSHSDHKAVILWSIASNGCRTKEVQMKQLQRLRNGAYSSNGLIDGFVLLAFATCNTIHTMISSGSLKFVGVDKIFRCSVRERYSIPPAIESDLDSEGDIVFLDNLLNDDPIPEYERFTFDIEPDAPVINNFDELNEDECFDPGGGEIDVFQNIEDDDSFTFVIQTFLPYRTYPVDSPLLLSTGSEDTIFDPGIST